MRRSAHSTQCKKRVQQALPKCWQIYLYRTQQAPFPSRSASWHSTWRTADDAEPHGYVPGPHMEPRMRRSVAQSLRTMPSSQAEEGFICSFLLFFFCCCCCCFFFSVFFLFLFLFYFFVGLPLLYNCRSSSLFPRCVALFVCLFVCLFCFLCLLLLLLLLLLWKSN